MAKKDQTVKAKPNCIYCKHGKDIGNHMSLCPFFNYPRSNGIRGFVQCDVGQFELDQNKYNKYHNKSPT